MTSDNNYIKIRLKGMYNSLKGYCMVSISCILLIHPAAAQVSEKEAYLKAAFIYNFTKYIEWNSGGNDFTICVIGDSPVYGPLTEIAAYKTVQNKRIIIRKISKLEEIGGCNVLFIPATTSYPLSSIFANTGKGTLTISETPGYANLGTAINFVIVNDKLKFEANVKSINDEGLKASSQLLKLAKIID